MENKEMVTITRESYDMLERRSKSLAKIFKDTEFFVEVGIDKYQQGGRIHYQELYSLKKDEAFELCIDKINHIQSELYEYKDRFGEIPEQAPKGFKRIFSRFYYKK